MLKKKLHKRKTLVRDLSWLSFNGRVLQEAADPSVPLPERIRFLGIYSNNMDEFFRVRVATLKRMVQLGNKARMHLEHKPEQVLESIQERVLQMQLLFEKTWMELIRELRQKSIFLSTDRNLNIRQQQFILQYFNEEVRGLIVPLMIEDIREFPVLSDKSIYLACTLGKKDKSVPGKFALISVPTRSLSRFVILPTQGRRKEHHIMLLEDVIRYCLPNIFSFFGFDTFTAHAIKVTRDAEIDIDNDVTTTLIQKIEKGLKNRKKGKPVRLVFDKEIPTPLLTYLVKRLGLSHKDSLIPGGRIHNFKDFMQFPSEVFGRGKHTRNPFTHPALRNTASVSRVIQQKDVMLHFPYHSFLAVIDLLREAAIDPDVTEIKITCYRLASRSKIINALINAARNGKQVTVVMELRARFDEEANLVWKQELEESGVRVLIGLPAMKVHAKLCLIRKRSGKRTKMYGFISTGNLNEKTARTYGDHCLLTYDQRIMADVSRIFRYLEQPGTRTQLLRECRQLVISPTGMRRHLLQWIDKEIRNARAGRPASILLKLNSLSDENLILKLYEAAREGVALNLIIRGICCMYTEHEKHQAPVQAISIVDEYLEHARVMIFHNNGKERVYISSADWMTRNIDHRVECACPVNDPDIISELKKILYLQLDDRTKARTLDNLQLNRYVHGKGRPKNRSQWQIYEYLQRKRGDNPIPDYFV